MTMQLILINHAERDRKSGKDDRDQPLCHNGVEQAHALADRLRDKQVTPTLYLTSKNVHAKETAEIVCTALGVPNANVVEIDALTPHHRTESWHDILEQVRASNQIPESHRVIAIVGHFPRLNQLFAYLTWRTAAPTRLNKGQEVYLTINSIDASSDGRGQGQWPQPSSSDRSKGEIMSLLGDQGRIEAIGEQLRAKIASKFTASTFLAGFALTVLAQQVFALWQGTSFPVLLPMSAGMVFGALVIFVAAVIKLDALTMPKRFWGDDQANSPLPPPNDYLTDDDLFELRRRMVFFWSHLTLVATVATAIAVFIALMPLGSLNAQEAQMRTVWWVMGGIAGAAAYWIWIRFRESKFPPLQIVD